MMRRFAISAILCISLLGSRGQEVKPFSQYFGSSLFLNPAFAGLFSTPNLSLNYRQGQPQGGLKDVVMQASFVFPIIIGQDAGTQLGGVGVTAYNGQQGKNGVEQVTGYMLSYAHNFRLGIVSPDVIIVSAQAGYEIIGLNFSELAWGSQSSRFLREGFDPTVSGPVTEFDDQTSHIQVNAGVVYVYNRERNYLLYNYTAYSGFAVTNVNRADKSFSKDGSYKPPMLWKYHGGFEFNFGTFYASPSMLVNYVFPNTLQVNAGAYISYPTNFNKGFSLDSRGLELIVGAWYRLKDSFIFIVGFNNDQLGARVSYDLNSSLFYPSRIDENYLVPPAFEISLQYNISSSSRLRKVSNPLF